MRFLSPMLLRAGAVVLFIMTVLSACTVVVDDDSGGPIRPGPICSREYDPVCGRRGGDRQTFANACLADEAGYRVTRRGECRRDDNGGGGGGMCTQQYDPVCARRGGDRQTFSNSCLAERAGYRVIRGGECGRGDDDGGDRACTREYAPVCARGRGGGAPRTFPNGCEAESAGYRIIGRGPC